MDLDKELKFKYYNLKSLAILLFLTGINIHLNNTWTSDKGYLLFMIIIFGTISITFWFILSTISSYKEAYLKSELFYYLGVGIWQIIMTIEYFKFKILDKNDILGLMPYLLIIILTLLPIKKIWTIKKD